MNHKRASSYIIDQDRLTAGAIQGARGPPEHRYYQVDWADGEVKWLDHVHFQEEARVLIDEFFFVNSHLDFYSALEGTSLAVFNATSSCGMATLWRRMSGLSTRTP